MSCHICCVFSYILTIIMSGDTSADKTGVTPHSNVVMATLKSYGYTEGTTKVFSEARRYILYEPRGAHPRGLSRSRRDFSSNSKHAVWFEHDYCAGAFGRHWPHVQGVLPFCGQCVEPRALMIN